MSTDCIRTWQATNVLHVIAQIAYHSTGDTPVLIWTESYGTHPQNSPPHSMHRVLHCEVLFQVIPWLLHVRATEQRKGTFPNTIQYPTFLQRITMHICTQNTGSKWPLWMIPSCSGMFLVASMAVFFSGCCDKGKHIDAQFSFTSWSRGQLSQDCIMWIMAHGHMYRSARRTLLCNVEPNPNTNTKHAYHTVQWESSSELPTMCPYPR